MATIKINFINIVDNERKITDTIYVTGRKMPKSWVHKVYGSYCDDTYYYIGKKKNNPYGRMWVSCSFSTRFYDNTWSVCQLMDKGCKELPKYTHINCQII